MKRIEIKKSKKKFFLMLIGTLILALISFNLCYNAEEYTSYIFRNSTVIRIVGLIATVFCCIGFITLLKKLSENDTGLVIDEIGIVDNSSAASVGLIEWNDIVDVRRKNVMSTQFLLIDVVSPDKYLNKPNHYIKLKLMNYNIKLYGTPISITSSTLSCNIDELEILIRTNLLEYRNKFPL